MEDVKSTEAKRISFGGYQWIILEEKDNKILILTEEIIGQRDYHSDLVDITWEDSEMRQYLNSTFYETFLCGDDVYNHPYRDINGDGGIRPAMWIRI